MAELARKSPIALNRFDRRREKTRLDLLQAAERVISRKGYHDARIADIAEDADVGLGTFYLHFRTKNEIFIELVEQGAAELRHVIDEAKAGVADPAGRLRIVIHTVLDSAAEHPELFRIVFGHGPAFLDLMVRVHAIFIDDLRRDLEPALAERADAVANLTIGMLSQAVTWLLERGTAAIDELKSIAVDFALGGLERVRTGARS